MDIRKLAAEGRTEEIERQLMDLDSQFSFKCRKCGKCCKHQDTILFNTRDIFNIACKLQLTMEEVINEYAETYIGSASKIPVVHMVPRGQNAVYPFLKDGLCSIHDSHGCKHRKRVPFSVFLPAQSVRNCLLGSVPNPL